MKLKQDINSIGVLGGTFDPPHRGHLFISKQSIKKLKLKKVIWAITKKNPFKKKPIFSLSKRIEMCRKLISKNRKIKIKFFEKKLRSNSSFKLIKYLKKKEKGNIFFIMGSDNLIKLHKWRNHKEFVKSCNIVVFSRKGFEQKVKKSVIIKLLKRKNFILMNKKVNISSTQLRLKLINAR